MSFVVYAIQSTSGRIYVGQTADVTKRIFLHNAGAVLSTKGEQPWVLLKTQVFNTREEARYFEWCVKRSRGKRQKWLVEKSV